MSAPSLPRLLVSALFALVITILIMIVLLFGGAGTLDWPHGWAFIGIFSLLIIASVVALWRLNPEIFAARARPMGPGTKGWDRVLMPLLLVAFAAILPVAGLDDGRYHALSASGTWVDFGYLLVIAGFFGVGWAEAVNRHFEPSVRIQTDRNQRVVSTGPYAIVRHPGYVAASLLAVGMAWALGSWWAVLPALGVILVLVIRTRLEDRTLQRELPGYADYASQVRYRWIPGIW